MMLSEVTWRLMFATALAAVAVTGWVTTSSSDQRLRDAQVASCERGNQLRRNQLVVLDVLIRSAERFQLTDPDPRVRMYLRARLPELRAARTRIPAVDCNDL